ncbi:MAG: RNA polymerase sigma factor [Polyangiaceae bacterium]
MTRRESPLEAPSTAVTTEPLQREDLAMQRYADGDDTAFAEVFAALTPRLRAFLWRLSGSPELADDLTQETLLRMHHARGSFAEGRRVAPWAYAIARNCWISHARSAQTRLAGASGELNELELAAGPDASGEETSIARQSARVVERALASMTEARREAFVLLRYEGMSVSAAAQIVGVSEGALKIRAFHAYEIIRGALDDMGSSAGSPAAGSAANDKETKPPRARRSGKAATEPEQA